MILKNIFYAILLGVGMAACLSQNDQNVEGATAGTAELPIIETTEEPVTPSADQLRITPGKVGFITISDDIEQMRQTIPAGFAIADTMLQQEGTQATAYIIRPENEAKGLLVEQQCNPDCKVWRLNVQSGKYRTIKGVGVGDTYEKASKQHPINTVTLADGGLVAVTKDGGMTFVLDTSQIPASDRSRLTPENIPADTRVKAILIY